VAAVAKPHDRRIIAEINVTPLVDIVLVLLIIFMVTATYIVRPSIDVAVPEASTGEDTVQTTLAIVMTKSGELYANGQPIVRDALRSLAVRLRQEAGARAQVVLAADKQSSHGQVVEVMDLVRQAGISRFAITVTRPRQEGELGVP